MEDDATRALAEELLRYLARHPGAADTVEGIQRWWLPGSVAAHRSADVEAALERLVEEGALARRRLPDGRLLYSAAGT